MREGNTSLGARTSPKIRYSPRTDKVRILAGDQLIISTHVDE